MPSWIEQTMNPSTQVIFPGGHAVNLLPFRAAKHDFARGWEYEYLVALEKSLQPGMTVYDVGAENGEFGAFAATIVKPHNVHLFEPSAVYWPNLKALWAANFDSDPGGCYEGFVDEMTSRFPLQPEHFGWPGNYEGRSMFEDTAHLCLHQRPHLPSINIDTYVEKTARPPDVLLIDCEGAEVRILKGAHWTLTKHRPIVFVSLHDEVLLRNHGSTQEGLFKYMADLKYDRKVISIDHETHLQFTSSV